MNIAQSRIKHINFLQFIGPILVILGHSLNGITSDGLWWLFSKQWIYIFHMPLFFMMAGYLLSYKKWLGKRTYVKFIKRKFIRLIVPYLFWNLSFVLPKYLLQDFLYDDLTFEFEELFNILIRPRTSIWGHTWFLVALFLVYLFTPFWRRVIEAKAKWILLMVIVLSIIVYVLPINTKILCLNDLHKDLPFFIMGGYLGTIELRKFEECLKKNAFAIFSLSVVTSVISVAFYELESIKFIPCFFVLLGLLLIPIVLNVDNNLIDTLAQRSFGIYIMHWPIMIAVRIILGQIMGMSTVIVVICMIVSGYFIPNCIIVILKNMKLGKVKKVMQILLGI